MSNKSIRWAFNFGTWNPSPGEILLATSCIQREEKQRIAKFVFKKDFKSSLIGRLMIRKFVALATNLPYNEIVIIRDDKGKPIFKGEDSNTLDFNVSHHGNFTVLAGEIGGTKLGTDVMQIGYSGGKSLNEFFRIMNRQFSRDEWVNIRDSATDIQQLITFCRNWSLKESYVKAIGVGITVNLQNISFKIDTRNKLSVGTIVTDTELFVHESKVNWLFEETMLDDKHCVATALYNNNVTTLEEYTNKQNHFKFLSFEELTKDVKPLLETDEEYCNNFFKKDN